MPAQAAQGDGRQKVGGFYHDYAESTWLQLNCAAAFQEFKGLIMRERRDKNKLAPND
jgi:hypothetical protein